MADQAHWRSAAVPTVIWLHRFLKKSGCFIKFFHGRAKELSQSRGRVIGGSLSLDVVPKCCLIPMDSTIKSNLSVGLPLGLPCFWRDSHRVSPHKLIAGKDPYFASIRGRWVEQLRQVFNGLPDPGNWR